MTKLVSGCVNRDWSLVDVEPNLKVAKLAET